MDSFTALRKSIAEWREMNPTEGDPVALRMHPGTLKLLAVDMGIWPPKNEWGDDRPWEASEEPDWAAEGSTILGIVVKPDVWMLWGTVEIQRWYDNPAFAPWIARIAA
jgi:hypothetical protein